MFPVLGAASSAIDALKALTSTKPATGGKQDAPNLFAFAADASASSATASGSGTASQLSPETMNALLAAQDQSGSMRSGSLKEWFANADSDADGKISKSEFEALSAGGSNGARTDEAFSRLDTDGDGSISPAELLAALKGKRKHSDQQSHPLLQALEGASAAGSDTSVTAIASRTAASSYNFMDQLIPRPSGLMAAQASSSLSVSV